MANSTTQDAEVSEAVHPLPYGFVHGLYPMANSTTQDAEVSEAVHHLPYGFVHGLRSCADAAGAPAQAAGGAGNRINQRFW
jgi:hypothetical protein